MAEIKSGNLPEEKVVGKLPVSVAAATSVVPTVIRPSGAGRRSRRMIKEERRRKVKRGRNIERKRRTMMIVSIMVIHRQIVIPQALIQRKRKKRLST